MKKSLKIIATLIITVHSLSAQTALPYFTNFDTPASQTGWTSYRNGSVSSSNWTIASSGYSPQQCLVHFYPVGGSSVTVDWFVSPPFNLSAGGNIDSLRTNFSGFGNPGGTDFISIYLLVGSPNPTLAVTKTLLYNFAGTSYTNDAVWRLKTNIAIPSYTGTALAYIAFKYETTNNWLDVKFDNLRIKS